MSFVSKEFEVLESDSVTLKVVVTNPAQEQRVVDTLLPVLRYILKSFKKGYLEQEL